MEQLTAPPIKLLHSQRFQILPLWNWSLAVATLDDCGREYVGLGFAADRTKAHAKAHSEAIERFVYRTWTRTGISPFTRRPCAAPIASTGFAAHIDRNAAAENAFLEWRERAGLAAVQTERLALSVENVPSMGLLFGAGLQYLGCKLRGFVSATAPYIAFVLAHVSPSGVIFGTSCRYDAAEAIRAASAECLRKTACLDRWNDSDPGDGELRDAARYWLSHEGANAAETFVERALKSAPDSWDIPASIDAARLQTMKVGEFWVSHYVDERYPLPEVRGKVIPLI